MVSSIVSRGAGPQLDRLLRERQAVDREIAVQAVKVKTGTVLHTVGKVAAWSGVASLGFAAAGYPMPPGVGVELLAGGVATSFAGGGLVLSGVKGLEDAGLRRLGLDQQIGGPPPPPRPAEAPRSLAFQVARGAVIGALYLGGAAALGATLGAPGTAFATGGAIVAGTRYPKPLSADHDNASERKVVGFFSGLVGLGAGALGAHFGLPATLVLGTVGLALGAFHEHGIATGKFDR